MAFWNEKRGRLCRRPVPREQKSQARHNRSAGNRWTRDSFVLLVGVRLGIVVWSYGAWYSAVFVFVLLVKL
jgi:hypothetical protein